MKFIFWKLCYVNFFNNCMQNDTCRMYPFFKRPNGSYNQVIIRWWTVNLHLMFSKISDVLTLKYTSLQENQLLYWNLQKSFFLSKIFLAKLKFYSIITPSNGEIAFKQNMYFSVFVLMYFHTPKSLPLAWIAASKTLTILACSLNIYIVQK